VSGNQAVEAGGGIWNDLGVLELVRSTISGNVAHDSGGGIANTGTATLRNVTISGNTADVAGGGIRNLGSATLNNTTVAANTLTGIVNEGQLIFMNTLLANNAGPDCQGNLTSRGFNLIRTVADCTFDGDTSGDLLNMNPELGPLQDNGGPTFTHALLEGSAALDAANPTAPGTGDPACEETDQRGVARPQGPRCDTGAFEACADMGSPGGAMVDACVGSCGDGVVSGGEECDDGSSNGTPGDPCDASCRRVSSEPGPGPGLGPEPTCGDGVVDSGEECDDGNMKNDDGCSSTCKMEEPITCKDDRCDQGHCDADGWFKDAKCVLESPVCKDELVPRGVIKRIVAARHRLGQAWQGEQSGHGKKFVTKAVRLLNQAERIRRGVARKGRLSPECAAALDEMLSKARQKCQGWRSSF
jgi:cysteine-rich repeat protein